MSRYRVQDSRVRNPRAVQSGDATRPGVSYQIVHLQYRHLHISKLAARCVNALLARAPRRNRALGIDTGARTSLTVYAQWSPDLSERRWADGADTPTGVTSRVQLQFAAFRPVTLNTG
ncbi:hypothetical protein EVAR_74843_1 [Eumeta japonica]|uniref:Uncharacterized protein n=1 Tax=Eumeta variegata TaxID=151549 RepID=A0A4C1SPM7_EUMVA|nr:hypothetical protein EVAR_74843_1 [Eumeta japonica]